MNEDLASKDDEPRPHVAEIVHQQPRFLQLSGLGDEDKFFSLIARIATSPGVSLDVLDRTVALWERVRASQAKATFDRDLAAMQPRLPTIDATGKIVMFSKEDRASGRDVTGAAKPMQSTSYATMADINDAIRPGLAEYGFALSFRSGQVLDGEHKGKILVTGILSHKDGHREEVTLPPLQYDSTGSKNSVQALGSTLSYGRRYATLFILNISSRAPIDGDDDGRKSGEPQTVGEEKAKELEQALADCGGDLALFKGHFDIKELADLPTARLEEAQGMIAGKAAKKAKTAAAKAAAHTAGSTSTYTAAADAEKKDAAK